MWLLLQPRGALGGYFLYIALVVAAIGIMFGGYEINYPAFTNLNPDGSLGEHFWTPMFPILFITIACGACSGFHALVSSGTSSKQLAKETDATAIGYGAMLLEGMVAVVSIVCVMNSWPKILNLLPKRLTLFTLWASAALWNLSVFRCVRYQFWPDGIYYLCLRHA